jgi:hypothetical protein
MPNRVDLSGGSKKPEAAKGGKGGKSDGGEDSKGNAIKIGIVVGCLVLAGVVLWYNFRPVPPPPPQPSFDPLADLPPEQRKLEERRIELQEQNMKKNPPAGS